MNERDLFLTALDIDDTARRRLYLDSACGGDQQLRERVEALLASHADAGSFLGTPAVAQMGVPFDSATGEPDETLADPPTGAADPTFSFLEPSQKPRSLGRLGHYEILELVGKGAMGIVFKAFDEELQRVVAVKVLAPELATSPIARQRFSREAAAAAAVSHEHVVTIHAVQPRTIPPYLVMQFVSGISLQDKLALAGPLPALEITRIAWQAACGLAAAHKQGLVHRDIKPANILLENGIERVKITDFGLARASDDAQMTQSGMIAGTPQYMSPEQALGEQLDSRSDLFSLGSVMYAMCTGRPAFRADSTVGVLRRVCDDTPRPIREVNAEIPEWLVEIVEKLMGKRPDDRFQSAQEAGDLLGEHLAELQRPTGREIRRVSLVPSRTSTAAVKKPLWRRWMTAALVLAGIALGVWRFGPALVLTARNEALMRVEPLGAKGTLVLRREGRVYKSHEGRGDLYLVPGTYEVEIVPPPGQKVNHIAYFHQTLFTGHYQPNTSPQPRELYVGRGDYVKLTASFYVPAESGADFSSEPGWTPLFDGRSLAGWTTDPDKQGWRIENGRIVGSGSPGFLVSEKGTYGDFHVRARVRIAEGGDSGLYFRARPDSSLPRGVRTGYEAQAIGPGADGHREGHRVGSLYRFLDGQTQDVGMLSENLVAENEWFVLEAIAEGDHLRIKVNGKQVVEYTDPDPYLSGHLAFDLYKPAGRVEIEKIEIKELSAQKSDPVVAAESGKKSAEQPRLLRRLEPPPPEEFNEIVSTEEGAWRIENKTNMGNFKVVLGTLLEDIPEEGLIIFRAKVKVEARHELAWGELLLGDWSPSHYDYAWPRHLAHYEGNVATWTAKEIRYPARAFHEIDPPQIVVQAGLHANGVLWIKDVEILHLPGKVRSEAAKTSEAAAPTPESIQKLQRLAGLAQKAHDVAKAQHLAGVATEADLTEAEIAWLEADLRVAAAQNNKTKQLELAEQIVARRTVLAETIKKRRDAGQATPSEMIDAEKALIEAQLRQEEIRKALE